MRCFIFPWLENIIINVAIIIISIAIIINAVICVSQPINAHNDSSLMLSKFHFGSQQS